MALVLLHLCHKLLYFELRWISIGVEHFETHNNICVSWYHETISLSIKHFNSAPNSSKRKELKIKLCEIPTIVCPYLDYGVLFVVLIYDIMSKWKEWKNSWIFWTTGQIILAYFKANSQYLTTMNEKISRKVSNHEMVHLNSKLTPLE